MEKIPLFVNLPVSESVLQAFPAVEEIGGFYFHTLKLDPDIFELMIDARPCVAVFSIPDASSRQEVCALLEEFGRLRESLGYPKRDPTLRTILVAEEKAVSLERWHDLGVHEFIIAPILPRALAYKISRHHQRAASCAVPGPYQEKDEVVVIRGNPSIAREEVTYGRGPREPGVPLSEVTNLSRGIRSFVGEKTGARARYSVLTSIPELKEQDGHWEQRTPDASPQGDDQEPQWSWAWNRPQSGHDDDSAIRRGSWNYRGDRPEYDTKKRAWKLSGEKPALELRKEHALPEKLIDSVETRRGREIIVPESRERLDVLEVLELRQAGSPEPRMEPPSEPGFGGTGGPRAQEDSYHNRIGPHSGPASSLGRGSRSPRPEDEASPARPARGADSDPEGDEGDPKKPAWKQHISQSQRSLERTLITERERIQDWNVAQESTAELPPELEEISRKLLGNSAEEKESEPASTGSIEEEQPSGPAPLAENAPQASEAAAETLQESKPADNDPVGEDVPEDLFPDTPDDTNPYLDGREGDSEPAPPDASSPDPAPASGGEDSLGERHDPQPSFPSRGPALSSPIGARAGWAKGRQDTPSTSENPIALDSPDPSRPQRAPNIRSGKSDPGSDFNLHVGNSPESDRGNMKVLSKENDPNTWSMQNLDELSGQVGKRKRPQKQEPSAEEGASTAEDTAPPEIQLFETGEKPSLEQITAGMAAQTPEELEAALREGRIPEELMAELMKNAPRDPAWLGRLWRRIQALLKRMRR